MIRLGSDKNGDDDDEGQHQVLTKVRCCRGKTFSLIPQIPLHLLSRSKVSLFYHHHLNHLHYQCYRPRHHYCHRYHLRRCRCCHHHHHCRLTLLLKWNIVRKWVCTLQYKRIITIFFVDSQDNQDYWPPYHLEMRSLFFYPLFPLSIDSFLWESLPLERSLSKHGHNVIDTLNCEDMKHTLRTK